MSLARPDCTLKTLGVAGPAAMTMAITEQTLLLVTDRVS
jgi:hypothetical protein